MRYRKVLLAVSAGMILVSNIVVAAPGDNIALGKAYTLTPSPNYDHPDSTVTNSVGDDTDLTDGIFVRADHGNEGTVTWQVPAARIDLDLAAADCQADGTGCPAIAEILFQVQANNSGAGVHCPARVLYEVSDDGLEYHPAAIWTQPQYYPTEPCGENGLPTFTGRNFIVSTGPLQTRGAHVRLTIYASGGNFIFIDEVQVIEGTDPTRTNYLPESDFEAGLDALGPDWRLFNAEPLAVMNAHTLPPKSSLDAAEIALSLAKGEQGYAALMVSNPRYQDLGLDITPSDLVASTGSVIPASAISVRQGIDAPSAVFDFRSDALPILGTQAATIGQRAVSHLFIDLSVPRHTAAGTYQGDLVLTCQSGCGQVKKLPIRIEVLPYRLPAYAELSARFFDWSYAIPESAPYITGALADERAAIRRWAGNNTHLTYLAPLPDWLDGSALPLDFTGLDAALDRYGDAHMHILYLAGAIAYRRNFENNACYPSAEWDSAYTDWIRQINNHMLQRGLRNDQYAFYVIDEPRVQAALGTSGNCPDPARNRMQFLQDAARLIRAVDAQAQVWANPIEDGSDMALISEIAMEGLVDIWVPAYSKYFGSQVLRDFYRSRQTMGEQLWTYSGPIVAQSHGEPYRDGRLTPWTLWQNNITGYGYWALFAAGRLSVGGASSVWDPFDSVRLDYSIIYLRDDAKAPAGLPQNEAIIPSRRLAGLRQGIEDYRYLTYLDDLIRRHSMQGEDTSGHAAVLNDAVAAVLATPADVTRANQARAEIAQAITQLTDDVKVISVSWHDKKYELKVRASSSRQPQPSLTLTIDNGETVPMQWNARRGYYEWEGPRPTRPAVLLIQSSWDGDVEYLF